jgi:hypothetical protein
LLLALRESRTVDDALKIVSQKTLAQWDTDWRGWFAHARVDPLSPMFGLGSTPPGIGDSRERARLAELLFGRGHATEALVELDKIPEAMLADPSLRYVRARALEKAGKTKEAETLLEEPKAWVATYGPCWAVRARLAEARGDAAVAAASFDEALAHDPLGVESVCRGESSVPLCDAAKKRDEPDLGQD